MGAVAMEDEFETYKYPVSSFRNNEELNRKE